MRRLSPIALAILTPVAAVSAFVSTAAAVEFHEYMHGSGMRVILAERPGSDLVASSVYVRAGSIRESEPMNGAAHYLEHLLFNGTENRTQEELYAEVDRIGAYNNATTQSDFALYMFMVGSDEADRGLDLHADMLFNSILPEGKFEKEKGIVLEELAKDTVNESWQVSTAMDALFWPGAPLGRSGLGSPESISGMNRDDVLAYYRDNYVASNMTLLLMGDLTTAEMKELVDRTYGRHARVADEPARHDGTMTLAVGSGRGRPLDVAKPQVSVRLDAPPPSDPDAWPIRLLVDVWGRSGGRLEQAMKHAPTLPVSDLAARYVIVGGSAYVELRATLDEGSDMDDAGRTITRLLAEVHRAGRDGVDDAELSEVKTKRRVDEASLSDKIHYYALMQGPDVLYGDTDALANAGEAIAAVSGADVSGATERWLWDAKPRVVGVGRGFPDLDTEYAAVSDPAYAPATPFAASARGAAPFDPNVPRVTKSADPEIVVLANGLRVVVAADPQSEVLAMHLAARGRSYVEPEGKAGIADFLHRTLLRGTSEWTRAELHARLGAIGAEVKTHDEGYIPYDDYYTTADFSFVRFETIDAYYREAANLLAAVVRSPRFDVGAIESVREEMIALADARRGKAVEVGEAALDSLLFGTRAAVADVGGTRASLESIDAAALREFHASYFAPENLLITVVTSVEPGAMIDALAAAFGTTVGNAEAREFEPLGPQPVVATTPVEVRHALEGEQAFVGLGYAFEYDPDDRAALVVASRVLSSRLVFHLRERLGMAYSIGAGFSAYDGRGTLTADMGTRPENVERALTELSAQIDSLAIAPIDDALIEQLSTKVRGRMRMRQITRMGRAYYLALDALHDNELRDREQTGNAESMVAVADVRRVAQRYFDASRAHHVVIR